MEHLLQYWQQAAESTVGIALSIDGDREAMRTLLYKVRIETGAKEFEGISIITPPIDDELWLVRRDTNG
jgi:hypothetical protein